jgi:hypothetical protein
LHELFDIEPTDDLMSEFTATSTRYNDEISQLAAQFNQMKTDLKNQRMLFEPTTVLSADQLEELQHHYEAERARLAQEHRAIEEEEDRRHGDLKRVHVARLGSFNNEIAAVNSALLKSRATNQFAVELLKGEQSDALHIEYAEYEARRSLLFRRIGEYKTLAADIEGGQSRLRELEAIRADMVATFEATIAELEERVVVESAALLDLHDAEMGRIQESERVNLAKMLEDQIGEVQRMKDRNHDAKQFAAKRGEEKRKAALDRIGPDYATDGVMQRKIQEYSEMLKKLQKEFADSSRRVGIRDNQPELNELIARHKQQAARISGERSALLETWMKQYSDEIDRHHREIQPAISKASIDSLRLTGERMIQEMEERIDSLAAMLSSSQIRERLDDGREYNDDHDVLKLKKILATLRVTLAAERKAAVARMETDVANAQHALEQAKIDQQNAVEREIADEERETRKFHSHFSSLKIEMTSSHDALTKMTEKSANEFSENLGKIRRRLELNMTNMKSQINTAKSELEKVCLHLASRREEVLCSLEGNLLRQTSDLGQQIGTVKKAAEQERQLFNMAQSEAVGKRDLVKQLFVERGPRPQEETFVARLKGVLDVVTRQLGVVLKDHQYYRGRMQTQEWECNQRFGAAPQIAVLKGASPTRIAIKRPLPPLHNSVKC